MNTDKIQLLREYKTRCFQTNGNLELCVDDFVQHIIGSKSVQSYVNKIKDKTKRNDLWYRDAEKTISEFCPKTRSKQAKEFQEKWKSLNTELASSYENPDTLTSFLDIRNNYFQYKGKKVLVVVKDGVLWFKGIDIAKLLGYDLSRLDRIYSKISEEDKLTFDTDNHVGLENKINLHKAIFITLAGMFTMVMQSIKPEARQFQSWVCREVLPSINRFGSYSIEKKYGCFYDDHDLYEYDGCNVCYMAYIGVHDGIPLFKYGITFDYYRREYQEHRKTFDTFQLLYLRQTDNNHAIESLFTKECKSKDIYIQREFKGKNRTELFTINEFHSFERMRIIMDKLIEQNPTKEYKKYETEIVQLKQEKDNLMKTLGHHQTLLTEKTERIHELKSHNEFLQIDKESLQKEKNQLFEFLKQKLGFM